jgi:glutamate racemase
MPRPVLFLDSGTGGIPYCRLFHERNPGESIVYLADRQHFPYGNKSKDELTALLTAHVKKLVDTVNPKIIVIVCNTASLASLPQLRVTFPSLAFVGTVPAVKPAALATKTGKIGVLGTEFTINEPYIRELAAQFGDSEVIGIAAPELVEFAEKRLDTSTPEEKTELVRGYINRFRAAGADVLVLGCTHFLFMLDYFRQEASPDITVFESLEGISQRIESLLAEIHPQEKDDNDFENLFLLTGAEKPEQVWIDRAAQLGFTLSLLGEL